MDTHTLIAAALSLFLFLIVQIIRRRFKLEVINIWDELLPEIFNLISEYGEEEMNTHKSFVTEQRDSPSYPSIKNINIIRLIINSLKKLNLLYKSQLILAIQEERVALLVSRISSIRSTFRLSVILLILLGLSLCRLIT